MTKNTNDSMPPQAEHVPTAMPKADDKLAAEAWLLSCIDSPSAAAVVSGVTDVAISWFFFMVAKVREAWKGADPKELEKMKNKYPVFWLEIAKGTPVRKALLGLKGKTLVELIRTYYYGAGRYLPGYLLMIAAELTVVDSLQGSPLQNSAVAGLIGATAAVQFETLLTQDVTLRKFFNALRKGDWSNIPKARGWTAMVYREFLCHLIMYNAAFRQAFETEVANASGLSLEQPMHALLTNTSFFLVLASTQVFGRIAGWMQRAENVNLSFVQAVKQIYHLPRHKVATPAEPKTGIARLGARLKVRFHHRIPSYPFVQSAASILRKVNHFMPGGFWRLGALSLTFTAVTQIAPGLHDAMKRQFRSVQKTGGAAQAEAALPRLSLSTAMPAHALPVWLQTPSKRLQPPTPPAGTGAILATLRRQAINSPVDRRVSLGLPPTTTSSMPAWVARAATGLPLRVGVSCRHLFLQPPRPSPSPTTSSAETRVAAPLAQSLAETMMGGPLF